eukprot:TCONS_00000443-protein
MSNNDKNHTTNPHDIVISKNNEGGLESPSDKHARIYSSDHLNEVVPHQTDEIILEREKSNTRRHVHRAQSFDKENAQKALFTPVFMKQCIVMSLWFFTSFASIVLNKYLLSTLDVDASLLGACQIVMTTFFGSIVMYVPYICNLTSRKRHKKMENFNRFQFYKTMSILGWLRCGAVICSVIGLKYVAVSFSETIKSSAPLFTALFAYFLLKEYSGIYVNLSLMPIMFGLAISTYTELSFNMTGFLAACTNNILDCIQNVFSKKLLCGDDMKFSPLELQFYTSVAATVVQVPLWFFFIDLTTKWETTDSYVASMLLFNGVVFYLQSLFAYSLMSLISPVTFSVSNTVKRAGLIWFSILVFGNKVTLLNLFGTVLVVAGVFLYQRARMMEQHKRDQMIVEEKLNHGNKEK